jgi:hypothetical protein
MAVSRAVERATAGTHKGVIVCFLPALLFFMCLLAGSFCFGQNKVQYALNDPRNPDCPCHKYQKMADDEYKKLHNGNTLRLNDNNNSQLKKSDAIGEDPGPHKNQQVDNPIDRIKVSTGGSSVHYRKKKPGTQIIKKINRAKLKYSKIKKQKPDYSVCYKW